MVVTNSVMPLPANSKATSTARAGRMEYDCGRRLIKEEQTRLCMSETSHGQSFDAQTESCQRAVDDGTTLVVAIISSRSGLIRDRQT